MLTLFLVSILSSNAQGTCSKSFSVSVDARKMDYFIGMDYHLKIQHVDLALGIEAGIVKTVFQQRFFPGFHLQVAYPLIQKERFSLAPAVDLNVNILQIQKASKYPNLFQECRLGYELKWGNKIKFMHAAGLGIITEHFYGAFSQKYKTAFGMGYSVKIGCLYVF